MREQDSSAWLWRHPDPFSVSLTIPQAIRFQDENPIGFWVPRSLFSPLLPQLQGQRDRP
ncbi:Uncharacterised protein [Vibrio cholerae]|nr:Uncharacterised protein [Vibrio cholerae]